MLTKNFLLTKIFTLIIAICLMQFFSVNSYGVDPEEILQDQKQELRARNISKNIRCMICQNQSIDESSASLAKDLRILIRNKIKEGNSNEEIYKFLTDRYGDFILLKPPIKLSTLALWVLPFVFLLIGIFVVFEIKGPNYFALQGNFFVYDKNKNIITKLQPENRFYPVTNNFTTEVSIHTNLLRDLYMVLGEGNLNDGWIVRIYYNPLVIWIWIGALTIFLGGLISMNSNLKKLQRLS